MDELSEVKSFFEGSHVLITGPTGFCGKALLEKLLRSCPGIQTIYLLIRSKKGISSGERFDKVLKDPLFNTLKRRYPNFIDKIVILSGDCTLPNFGLSETEQETVLKNVTIVYHVAAMVKWYVNLKYSAEINVGGTVEMMKLAQKMTKLKILVHVSTTYCPYGEEIVEERFYPPPACADRIMKLSSALTAEEMKILQPKLLEKWPTTYLHTKSIAEEIVRRHEGILPICVVRPAIVQSSAFEPVPGWIDNINGPMALCFAVGMGVIKTSLADVNAQSNIIPVDLTVNCIIVASYQSAEAFRKGAKNINIFNYGSANGGSTWEIFKKSTLEAGGEIPFKKAIWCYDYFPIRNRYIFWIVSIFLHFIPAIILDAILLLLRKKPNSQARILKPKSLLEHLMAFQCIWVGRPQEEVDFIMCCLLRLFKIMMIATTYSDRLREYSTSSFKMSENNVRKLIEESSAVDKREFNLDIRTLNWEEYWANYARGCRKYIVKESLDTVPQGRRKLKIFRFIQNTLLLLLTFYFGRRMAKVGLRILPRLMF